MSMPMTMLMLMSMTKTVKCSFFPLGHFFFFFTISISLMLYIRTYTYILFFSIFSFNIGSKYPYSVIKDEMIRCAPQWGLHKTARIFIVCVYKYFISYEKRIILHSPLFVPSGRIFFFFAFHPFTFSLTLCVCHGHCFWVVDYLCLFVCDGVFFWTRMKWERNNRPQYSEVIARSWKGILQFI